jgi:hypothetical protein
MPIPLLAIGAGIVAAAGLAKSYVGARQANQAAKLAAANSRPNFDISKEYYTNQQLAQNQAQSGLGQESLDYYTNQAARGLTNSTDALLQTGAGANSIAGLYDRYQSGIGGIAAADAQAKRQNINNLMARNADIAGQESMQWSLNKYEPYKDTALAAAALKKQGTENIFSGIQQVGGAVTSYGNTQNYTGSGAGSLFSNGSNSSNANTAISTVNPSATINTPTYSSGLTGTEYDNNSNAIINDSLHGMENSPYRELIRKQLQSQYGRTNSGMVA